MTQETAPRSKGDIARAVKALEQHVRYSAQFQPADWLVLRDELLNVLVKAEALHLVLSVVSAKANIDTPKLIELLEDAERTVMLNGFPQ